MAFWGVSLTTALSQISSLLTPSAIGAAAASHSHAASDITSATLALSRMISGATAGAPVHVDNAGTALESAFPPTDICTGHSVTTTPEVAMSIALPAAGSYLLQSTLALVAGTVTGTRTVTAQFDITNFTSCNISSTVMNSSPAIVGRAPITASGSSHTLGFQTNYTGEIHSFGEVVVSAASVVTITMSISGDSATLRAGSFLRCIRKS